MGRKRNRRFRLGAGASPRRTILTFVIGLLLVASSVVPVTSGGAVGVRPSPAPDFAAQLVNPETIQLGTGGGETRLNSARDYIIKLPAGQKTGYTMLNGGRNILIDGGTIVMSGTGTDLQRRAIYIKNATGTVRIQNVTIRGGNATAAFDAIAISAPLAVVELVNLHVSNLHGSKAGFHGDIVQPFGGVKKLVINGLVGQTAYQGFYLAETQGEIGGVELSNVELSYLPNPHHAGTVMIWFDGCSSYPVTMQNVSIRPRSGQDVARSVRPNAAPCKPTKNGSKWSWPASSTIAGTITEGTSSSGNPGPGRPGRGDDGLAAVQLAVPGRVRPGGKVKLTAAANGQAAVQSVTFGVCKGTTCTWEKARKVKSDASPPFATTWKAPRRGTFTFLARATDADGNVAVSPAKTVKVKGQTNGAKKRKSKR